MESFMHAEYCATVAVQVAGIASQVSFVCPGAERHGVYIAMQAARASASVVGAARDAVKKAANLQALACDTAVLA
jgi:hypothetical protein